MRRKREAGYVAVSVALTIVLLCGFAALAVDIGVLLAARAAAQRAADAGALAGAFTFVTQPQAPQPDRAREHALSTALSNGVLENAISASDVNVQADVANRRVIVDIQHRRGTFFARAFGRALVDIAVRGVAEASPSSTGSGCVKPWFVPNTVYSALPPCDACAAGEVFIGADGEVTAWARARTGLQFTIKPGNPQNALNPGQFYAIRMPDSAGGADYRTNIETCSPDFVYCGETYGIEPGNMIGPTMQGVDHLTGPLPDLFLDVAQYQHADGTVTDTSHQLAVAPIWDICNTPGFCPAGKPAGGATLRVPVIGFALIFIDGRQANDVLARLIWASTCSSAGGASGGGWQTGSEETGPYSIPVRLVRLP
jgi:hypothetical protein